MCILLSSKLHPDYPLILLSNRDEFFSRPTQSASFVDPEGNVLSPLDMARQEHGTWIGVTKKGKIAVLVNYREHLNKNPISKISRGTIPQLFLNSDLDSTEWGNKVNAETNNFCDVGGFSLLFGELQYDVSARSIKPLNIISNRVGGTISVFNDTKEKNDTFADAEEDTNGDMSSSATIGLSNSLYLNPWPKVLDGEKRLSDLVRQSVEGNWKEDELISKCFEVLSVSNPPNHQAWKQMSYQEAFETMPNSIFVPPVYTKDETNTRMTKVSNLPLSGDYYGTRAQTVILVDKFGSLKYIEKNLHNSDDLTEVPEIHSFEFKIESWNGGKELNQFSVDGDHARTRTNAARPKLCSSL